MSRVDKDQQFAKDEAKKALDRYEEEVRERFESQQAQILSGFQTEFDKEKHDYMQEQNERNQTYQSIIKEIQTARGKLKDLESRSHTM